ncbi:hypothetical protein HYH02_012609 [Chlamydomonas schloesseri]|uniref:HMG box domain-containing protein n=1 Tax=Chlamydomonas schloesseri TaxID=2026947 RepID=A0A835T8G3_9CHLO|nr:hypothetical protein HYH02_012609 [Chlamydomonas schloesseri]|eukprot:KAG2433491.1 hypothetical protein HYH02_012609 [Chlamydomonas schloesseri]
MAPTAYMLFCNEHRESIRQRLAAEGQEKIAVTVVAKELGQLWKTLSEEDKAKYRAQAEEQKQQQQQQQVGDGGEREAEGEGDHKSGSPAKAAAATLPASWVRKVVNLDSDIQRCSAEGVLALSAAAEVFLSAVCAKATATAAAGKRRTVRLDDVEKCVRGDKRLMAAGFAAVINMVAAAAATEAEGKAAAAAAAGAPPGKKQKVDKAGAPAAAAAEKHNSIERAFGMAS